MHLRHIRPRSVEWYDALAEELEKGTDRLSPEEVVKLRTQGIDTEHLISPSRAEPMRRAHETGRTR
jgi:hypothetical protein